MSEPPRNALVVVIDALRTDQVGACGGDDGLTPHIDEFANQATAFHNAFSCTNATDPSVTTLHSGRDPLAVAIHHASLVTPEEKNRLKSVTLLPEYLSDAGYRTVATGRLLGRWHRRGFDSFPNESVDRHQRRRIGEALERISPKLRSAAGMVFEQLRSLRERTRTHDEVDELLSHVDSGDGPFYGYVHMMDTHVPYEPDPELVERLVEERTYPNQDLTKFFQTNDGPYYTDFFSGALEPRDFEVGLARLFARYDAAVVEADRKVGRLVAGLKERDLLDETAVVIVSDHGESLDEHGIYFDHHGLYDQTIRVPMVVYTPNGDSTTRDEYVMLKDVPHTVLDLLGRSDELGGTGRSFASLVSPAGDEWEPRDSVVVGEAHAQRRLAIRTPTAKYITHVPDPALENERGSSKRCGYCDTLHDTEALFDLEIDPNETENLIDECPEQAEELKRCLMDYVDSIEVVAGDGGSDEFDDEDEVMQRLDDLGYV